MVLKKSVLSNNSRNNHQRGGAHQAGGAHAAPAAHSAHDAHSPQPERRNEREKAARRPRRSGGHRTAALVLGILGGAVLMTLAALFAVYGVFTVRYTLPGGTGKTELVLRGRTASKTPEPAQEGYTFIRWENEAGETVVPSETPVYEDLRLSAKMMPALADTAHGPYLFTDENGFLYPDAPMPRGETARILYGCLAVPVSGGENYSDVAADALWAPATAALKALGLVPGGSFRPEEPVTLRELLGLFGAFYPQLSRSELAVYADGADPLDPETPYTLRYTFADAGERDPDYALFCTAASRGWIDYGPDVLLSPDEPLSRAQAAAYINRVLGRGQGLAVAEDEVGVIIDLPLDHPLYADLAEAAVPHTPAPEGDGESWESSQPFVSDLEEGLLFFGTQMYCADENGYLIKDGSWNGYDFGPDGRFTSGMPELDELVQAALQDLITDGMTDDEKLRAIYDYTVYNFTYVKGNKYERHDVSWAAKEAYEMLSTGSNNCYGFAGVFYELARALGFDPILISGFYGHNYLPHAWVEFEIDGVRYLCDPEVEWTYLDNPELVKPDMLMMTVAESNRWFYTR